MKEVNLQFQTWLKMTKFKDRVTAFRLRTLPLSLSTILMGNVLAYFYGIFSWLIFIFSFMTTISLQILSNLANDFGDSRHGADSELRKGPGRMVQQGLISREEMKKMIWFFIILSFVFGLILLFIARLPVLVYIIFLILGVLAILAAINYTISFNIPYGYRGYGDLMVFVFFGLVAVTGSFYLQTKMIFGAIFLPASCMGFFSTGVLNVNNIRDIESDKKAGKMSIPVQIGLKRAVLYHAFLLVGGFVSMIIYTIKNFESPFQFLFLLTLPLFIKNFHGVKGAEFGQPVDQYLKQLSISTLIFVLLTALGIVITLYMRGHNI